MRESRAPALVVAAHPDDEVLGCGGTIARYTAAGREVHVLLMTDGETARDATAEIVEAGARIDRRASAARQAASILGVSSVEMLQFPDNRMDEVGLLSVVKAVEARVHRLRPSTVLTHHVGDVNVDHRIVADAVAAACRPVPDHPVRELLAFEIPSSSEWRPGSSPLSFSPNWFEDISSSIEQKLAALAAYSMEMREFPHARSIEAVKSLAAWRGATVGVTAAEAFVLGRKIGVS